MNIFQDILGFLEGAAATNPAAAQAATSVKTAANDVEAAIEPIADDILNAVLERIPLVGGLITGPADALLNSVLDKLLARFDTTVAATASTALGRIAPAAQVTMQPIAN
jgi:hypothetical protein